MDHGALTNFGIDLNGARPGGRDIIKHAVADVVQTGIFGDNKLASGDLGGDVALGGFCVLAGNNVNIVHDFLSMVGLIDALHRAARSTGSPLH